MDRIDAWQLFLDVAEHGSFSEAARRAGVSAGQVSKRIAALEAQLKTRLFERTTRAVRLTDEGAALVERAASLVEAARALEAAPGGQAELSGQIRMTAPVTYGTRSIAPLVADFVAAHPGLSVRLALQDRHVDLIHEGYDLALRISAVADTSLVGRKLGEIQLKLVAAPDFLARHGRPERPRDLAELPCLIDHNLARPRQWRFSRGSEEETVRISGRFEADSAEAIRAACASGLGVALTPDFCVEDELACEDLVDVLPDWQGPTHEIWLIRPPGAYLAPRTRALIDHLVAGLAG